MGEHVILHPIQNMKSIFRIAVLCSLSLFAITSCAPDDDEELQEVQIDKSLIVGHWKDNVHSTEHWKYESMNSSGTGTGVFWDTSEMDYETASKGPGLFQYYFNSTGLMRIYWMEMNNSYSNPDTDAPYVIDILNSSTMKYHSSSTSEYHTFTRQ